MRHRSEVVIARLNKRSQKLMENLACIEPVRAKSPANLKKTFNLHHWDSSYNIAKEHGLALREKCKLEYQAD